MLSRRAIASKRLVIGSVVALTMAGAATGASAAQAAPAVTPPQVKVPVPAQPLTASKPHWALKLAIQYLPHSNHSQYDVLLLARGVPWFFGGSNVTGHGQPEIEYLKKGNLNYTPLPPGLHSWITAASAISPADIWAVTYLGGAVLRWTGGPTWTAVTPRGGWKAGTEFTGIIAISPRNVWLFGAGSRDHPGAGTWHWSGTGWTQVGGAAAGIDQAGAVSPTDIWGFGMSGGSMKALLHFGGTTWQRVSPRSLAGFRYSHILALGPDNVWVAGSVAGRPELGHYDGHRWTALTMPGSVAATGMCRDGHGGLWVIANSGSSPSAVRERSAGGIWTAATVSSRPVNKVLACAWIPGTNAVWGAGMAAGLPGSLGTAAAAYGYGKLP